MKKRGLIISGVIVLVGVWLMVVGYEFLEKENARFQTSVKAAKEEQQRCQARNMKYRTYDQFRTSIRMPYTSDLPLERWMRQYDTLRAGMSESEVEIILGAPDYAQCDVSKNADKFVGSEWHYAVAVPLDAANEAQNSGIKIVFGPDGKLADKNAMNMQPKPSPTPTPLAAATPLPVASPSGTPLQEAIPGATATPSSDGAPAPTPGANAIPAVIPSSTPAPQQAAPSATATPSPTPQ